MDSNIFEYVKAPQNTQDKKMGIRIHDFNQTLSLWIDGLERHTFAALCRKPSKEKWSLGQVYAHIIETTEFYLEQANACLATNDHAHEEMSPHAKTMFLNNAFPNQIIAGPASNAQTPQPLSKEELMPSLTNLRKKINETAELISASSSRGKTKHPGLKYFNAREWFQFAEMHLQHHVRQKDRLEAFLEACASERI